jgi:hypothetical protein
MLPNGHAPLNPDQLSPLYVALTSGSDEHPLRQLERKRGHALNLLSLSGGGQYGAFGAGFLNGWRESGRRPEFDIVGGVSTGALLATYALLGTPDDAAQLEEMYTQVTNDAARHRAAGVEAVQRLPAGRIECEQALVKLGEPHERL